MLKHRFFISFLSTVFLYAIFGLVFLYLLKTTTLSEENSQEKALTFSLSEYIPQEDIPIEETVEEIIEPQKEEVVEPEPMVEKIQEEPKVEEKLPEPPEEKIIPKPKPTVKKKPVIKKKKVKKRKPKKVKKSVSKRKRTNTKAVGTSAQHTMPKSVSNAAKNRFLNQIRRKIDRSKTYPRAAKRRGMQGSVKVKFTIFSNGQVGNIRLSGSKLFYSSARNAVKKAFPINVKNAPISLPQTVNVTLHYQLR